MCTTTTYVYVRPDGRRSATPPEVLLCPSSRFGRPCAAHHEVRHPMPPGLLPPATPNTAAAAGHVPHFPPTPNYSPRPSSRDSAVPASDGSRHSSTSSSRRRRDRSPGIYVNGQRVVDVHHSHKPQHRDRIMLVPNPPTPRTPPQTFNMPRTAPASPSTPLTAPYGSSPRDSYNRPYLVDERRMHLPVHPPSPAGSSRHSRQASTSSQGSRHSASAATTTAAEDEERRRQREERRIARKTQELRERIEKANAEIASRPTVRVVHEDKPKAPKKQRQPSPPPQQTVTTERRSRRDGYDEVVGAVGRMTVEDRNWKERRAHQRAVELEHEEQAAQDQRLRERTMPRRRATVGPGSRRHRVAYDDGLYRWE